MSNLIYTKRVERIINNMIGLVVENKSEYATPEHLLVSMAYSDVLDVVFITESIDRNMFVADLMQYVGTLDTVSIIERNQIAVSYQYKEVSQTAMDHALSSGHEAIDVVHIIYGILHLEHSHACYVLHKYFGDDEAHILDIFSDAQAFDDANNDEDGQENYEETGFGPSHESVWRSMVSCINDLAADRSLLVGRKEELERTIQILGRKDRNNVLHIGEPGVGKTALIYGLAQQIIMSDVPDDLKNCHIYSIDVSNLVAGAQMRGEFEKRFKTILEGVAREGNGIVYLDEMHTLAGAGQSGDGALDALSMLRPYLEDGRVRFIGSTTYQDYNRYLAKNRGIMRRFQQIDILEPSVEETLRIINGVITEYEQFHHVRYNADALKYAVEKSAALIADRCLPDKAIDIIDEAGSYRKRHPLLNKNGQPKASRYQTVDTALMNDVLAKVCKINAKALAEDANASLQNLDERITSQIYGQDTAVRYVVESIQMAKAGLLDPEKPLASLLFVGPTGVGKTELCKVLANELGIDLVRFDMSEYTEKHTVAKLIGSPAGYVGYEDGGLLTDAIRKTPNCVLLLDEIEKAHSDIYNILLQVMDYARLTDNRGNKADFKNVILIMTSNAGAQYASQGSVGFGRGTTRGEAMLQTVKKTFKPEFINRLSGTVVFNDMDRHMAELILDKKLRQLSTRLLSKGVIITLTPDARQYLLDKGYTQQYGAREMDRTLQSILNPLLTRQILFGKLKNGGEITIDKKDLEAQKQ